MGPAAAGSLVGVRAAVTTVLEELMSSGLPAISVTWAGPMSVAGSCGTNTATVPTATAAAALTSRAWRMDDLIEIERPGADLRFSGAVGEQQVGLGGAARLGDGAQLIGVSGKGSSLRTASTSATAPRNRLASCAPRTLPG